MNTTGSTILSGPKISLPEDICLHQLFAEQVQKAPDVTAVISEDDKLTYRELDGKANHIAHYLAGLGIREGSLIGVCAARSARVICALLGVLKAGCAYVPLDPAYPVERLADMMEDTQAPVVLTDYEHLTLSSNFAGKVISIDEVHARDSGKVSSFTSASPKPDSLAYVIYTSGSTGKPKGVCCHHRGVANLLNDFQRKHLIATGDICSWWTSLNFDVSVYEIFSALTAGASLIIVPETVRADSRLLMEWLCANGITSSYLPPFMVADLHDWMRQNPGKSPLRRLLVGVEPIPERTLSAICDVSKDLRIFNGYGPTEATVCATLYSVNTENPLHGNAPIGTPVQNTSIYLLDEKGRAVPPGCSGEIHIGGAGVAKGYLNRPELTSARFLPDPFSESPDALMYKTGDLARLLPDGNLEFIGRTDFQVKFCGFRIELTEIETQLRNVEGIREAAVLLREDEPHRQKLVAYLVASPGSTLTGGDLRDRLRSYLPDYMIPSAFVLLDRMPSTQNGKTDRDALPPPTPYNQLEDSHRGYREPVSPIQTSIAGFFKEILCRSNVGLDDDFFQLGGHSLLATQLVSRICRTFAVDLPLSTVFKSPTVEALSEEVEARSGESRSDHLPPIVSTAGQGDSPLSFSQMRVWYLDQLEPGTPAYNIYLAYRLRGALNLAALRESFTELVRRHESLRTIFRKRDGQPVQVISGIEPVRLDFVDLDHVSESNREREALRLAEDEYHRGFDLSTGPLFRVLILRLAKEHHVMVITVHHIVSDGWSMGIIVKELVELYTGFCSNERASLPPVSLRYGDFARWQRDWMAGQRIDSQIEYWKARFAQMPEPLELPTDRPRPAVQSYRGASRTLIIEQEVYELATELGKKEGVSLFMILLAAFKALLFRYTNQGDLCAGTFIANRNRVETENLVGFFINSLAMRTDLADNPSYETLLKRVRQTALGAYANQDVPFERLLEEINPPRNLSYTPLFQVMMVLQNMPFPKLDLLGLSSETLELKTFRSNFDLTLWLYEVESGIKAVLEYSTELFEEATAVRMLRHFESILRDAVKNPAKRISELDMLSREELTTIIRDWSGDLQPPSAPTIPVHHLFSEQAKQHPHRLAILTPPANGGQLLKMTYGELDRRSDRLAAYLVKKGVGRDRLVGIVMNRSPMLIIGILSVLKSGGAYVPIDASQPRERTAFIIRDIQAPLILTDEANLNAVSDAVEQERTEILCLHRDQENLEQEVGAAFRPASDMESLAYSIYTSGSTGQPKGVLIEHRALAAFIRSAIGLYHVSTEDRVLQFASPSFDASIEEIFATLCAGATLILRSDEMIRSMPVFLEACRNLGITLLDLPTAFWHQMVAALESGELTLPKSVRLVIIGGEQALPDKVTSWNKAVNGAARLINTYGPTETTVVATAMEIQAGCCAQSNDERVPIGRPLSHLKAFVLDPHGQTVPAGVVGELHIGGTALARGYLNQPERTAERFLADPFSVNNGARIYRTGDLVRFLPDGTLEFLGRLDRQVKIRGFRVELGEIETALNRLDGVKESAVVASEVQKGPLQLAAYIVCESQSELDFTDLRTKLARVLPDFMLPSFYTPIEKIPLTASGKIDARALPDPALSISSQDDYVAPRNPLEEILVEIWCDTFGIARVGIRDNFFDLGGHSLLSLQIIDRVNRAGLWLTPIGFMQNPTIEKLARVISTAKPAGHSQEWPCLVELQPHGSRPPLYFLHSTPGDVLGYMNLINHLGFDQPCYGFQSLGLTDIDRAHQRVRTMADCYINEMIAFQPQGPYRLIGWCYGGIVAAEMALQLRRMGQRVALLILIETPFPKTESIRLNYYLSRILGLVRMRPTALLAYIRNKFKYWQKVRHGDIERLFSLELDHGPLANREKVYRLNRSAIDAYRMDGLPDCPIRLFDGNEIEEGYIPDPQGLWRKLSSDVESYVFPGNHLTILKEPGVGLLAQKLLDCLDENREG